MSQLTSRLLGADTFPTALYGGVEVTDGAPDVSAPEPMTPSPPK